MLGADLDVAEGALELARLVHRMGSGAAPQALDRPSTELGGVGHLPAGPYPMFQGKALAARHQLFEGVEDVLLEEVRSPDFTRGLGGADLGGRVLGFGRPGQDHPSLAGSLDELVEAELSRAEDPVAERHAQHRFGGEFVEIAAVIARVGTGAANICRVSMARWAGTNTS